jgi:XTP/dITP diphosphohydrolase
MKKRIALGTKNKDKRAELSKMLAKSGIEVLSMSDFSDCPEAEETGKTFLANARIKAGKYARHTKILTLADDSGLMVNCLNGKPGVYSARFAGENCTYDDNNKKLLRLLKKVPASKRGAKMVCVMALYDGRKFIGSVKGECKGRIVEKEAGKNGFGYDPVFMPDGYGRTFAQLTLAEKSAVSHRGKALRAAKKAILEYYATP